jgi:hypothetical protein
VVVGLSCLERKKGKVRMKGEKFELYSEITANMDTLF